MTATNGNHYYIPEPSPWPILSSLAIFIMAIGFANVMQNSGIGTPVLLIGTALLVIVLFGWFRAVINESIAGKYNGQVDLSFRWSMGWFIFSEVMFFAAFFGALFYVRMFSIPWLGGSDPGTDLLWPAFNAEWPLINPPGAEHINTKTGFSFAESLFDIPQHVVGAWGIPAINTIILLTSGVTVTWAHWGLKKNSRGQLIMGLLATVILGFLFIGLQAYEYGHAMDDLNLTLSSGIYGSTFYMLTGFHGLHVTLGATMLTVILLRSIVGHFSEHNHFAFEAVAWYWHFVDVVWLGLFIFVYWL
jgi:cytochrome c oxidase subunit 3